MELSQSLIELGLSRTEAQIYLTLLELGEAKVGMICNRLDIPNSHIYRQLDSLVQQGLVTYKIANNIKIYQANDPESLRLLFEKKRAHLDEQEQILRLAIPKLRSQPKEKETLSDYKYFEGISGIKAMWLEMNELLIPKTQACYYTGTTDSWKAINTFYLEHHKIRAKNKVFLRMILPNDGLNLALQRKKIGAFDYRFLPIDTDGEFGAYANFVVIQYTSKKTKPRGFLIKDPIFVATFTGIFERLWVQARKK